MRVSPSPPTSSLNVRLRTCRGGRGGRGQGEGAGCACGAGGGLRGGAQVARCLAAGVYMRWRQRRGTGRRAPRASCAWDAARGQHKQAAARRCRPPAAAAHHGRRPHRLLQGGAQLQGTQLALLCAEVPAEWQQEGGREGVVVRRGRVERVAGRWAPCSSRWPACCSLPASLPGCPPHPTHTHMPARQQPPTMHGPHHARQQPPSMQPRLPLPSPAQAHLSYWHGSRPPQCRPACPSPSPALPSPAPSQAHLSCWYSK
jgi:hypothetical protein